jgi:hypothetical protein
MVNVFFWTTGHRINCMENARWEAFLFQAIERPATPLLDDVMQIGDCSGLISGHCERHPSAVLEEWSTQFVALSVVRLCRNL